MYKKEKILKKYGFKRKWLQDKSGYWLELKLNKHRRICADINQKHYYSEIKTYKLINHKWESANFETDIYFTSFKKLIKWLEIVGYIRKSV